jgi:hypothetical protein
LKRITGGRRIALSVPWCRLGSLRPPSACESAWPALQGAHHHLGARRDVGRRRHRLLDVVPDAPGAIEGDRLGGRVVARRQEGLDAVGERVESGRRGQERRQAEGQLGIADRPLRDQVGTDEAELASVIERDQRRAADFRAGAGGGRDGDDRRHGGGNPADAAQDRGELLQRLVVGGEQRHALAEVDGRAAAGGNDAVALVLAIDRKRGVGRRFRRVGWHVEEGDRARRAEREDLRDQSGPLQPAVADDQRPLDAERLQLVRQRLQCAGFELDGGEVGDRRHLASYPCDPPEIGGWKESPMSHGK